MHIKIRMQWSDGEFETLSYRLPQKNLSRHVSRVCTHRLYFIPMLQHAQVSATGWDSPPPSQAKILLLEEAPVSLVLVLLSLPPSLPLPCRIFCGIALSSEMGQFSDKRCGAMQLHKSQWQVAVSGRLNCTTDDMPHGAERKTSPIQV